MLQGRMVLPMGVDTDGQLNAVEGARAAMMSLSRLQRCGVLPLGAPSIEFGASICHVCSISGVEEHSVLGESSLNTVAIIRSKHRIRGSKFYGLVKCKAIHSTNFVFQLERCCCPSITQI